MGGGSLLGALDDPTVGIHERVLADGETLVLYTDGWLEAGPRESHCEPEELAKMAASRSGLPLEQLTDLLRRDAVDRAGGRLRDDMVVLAIRPVAA